MRSDEQTVLLLNCTLKHAPEASSCQLLAEQLLDGFTGRGAEGGIVRVVDLDVAPGVEADMGDGDEWPSLRARILEADIVVICTPTWLGHMSSVAQRVLERLDAELSETDDAGRPELFGKVAATAVLGNEDGAHKITADLHQALNDVGFTVPAQGGTYWNGAAMEKTDYKDLPETPEPVLQANATLVANALHLARLLARDPYPVPSSGGADV
ncbi:multimeric flavodoxin WrbA [Agromyces ramosus]|jgi:multimeric flavodoxin WrbA|uniref:Multimeric flavodoxin WrbA n=1 Tax=Agromyces ramosus TaxID=33879 RepID=A0A4Q7MHA0_9MICO|nr:NAD(P)H-dependent oxidoreductase [Agromyces ramosus]RZS66588.1 multimeric flavodoxin WrbA [Agromyces ramosus]